MARGIVASKPGTGGASMGKLIVTNGTIGPGTESAQQGSLLSIEGDCSVGVGCIVDFEIVEVKKADGSSVKQATKVAPAKDASGKAITNLPFDPTSPPATLTINANESQYIASPGAFTIPTQFTVNGGTLLIITDPSAYKPGSYTTVIGGDISSTKDGSSLIIDHGVTIKSKVVMDGTSLASIRNSVIDNGARVSVNDCGLILDNTTILGFVNAHKN